jgi:hypothetical protein
MNCRTKKPNDWVNDYFPHCIAVLVCCARADWAWCICTEKQEPINTHKAHVKNAQFATAEYLIPKPMKVMMMPVK